MPIPKRVQRERKRALQHKKQRQRHPKECVACSGSGKNSHGAACVPCRGTGTKQDNYLGGLKRA